MPSLSQAERPCPGRGLLSPLHNGTCEAKNTNLNYTAGLWLSENLFETKRQAAGKGDFFWQGSDRSAHARVGVCGVGDAVAVGRQAALVPQVLREDGCRRPKHPARDLLRPEQRGKC